MKAEDRDVVMETVVEMATDDFAGLWLIPSMVGWLDPDLDASGVKAETLEIVRDLVEHKNLRPGFPDSTGQNFVSWDMTVDQLIRYIDTEWTRLSHVPDIGEIVWFDKYGEEGA